MALEHASQLPLLQARPASSSRPEWDFPGEGTQYQTHGIHPYLASMIPQIPRRLLTMYAGPSTKVLDPFVGGGAVLVEALLAGNPSTGIDINPLAVIISKAKTTHIPRDVLSQASKLVHRTYRDASPDIPDFSPASKVEFWFKPEVFEPLGRLRATIKIAVAEAPEEQRADLHNLLLCVFSDTVRDVSLTYRGEVRLRRLQGKDFDGFNPDVTAAFLKRLQTAFLHVGGLPDAPRPVVLHGDTKALGHADDVHDLVITSPPYGDIKNTIPYHQFSKNMLYWLGEGDLALETIKSNSLGAKNGQHAPPKSESLKSSMDCMSKPNLIREAVCFYADYQDALAEIARVTRERIIIVIGHRILDGVVIDNPAITTEIMREIGWQEEARFGRQIRRKRISKKMAFGNNAQGGTIDQEAILVYKPGS